MTLDELLDYAANHGIGAKHLYEIVCDYKNEEAHRINKGGFDSQMFYLTTKMSLQEMRTMLRELAGHPE